MRHMRQPSAAEREAEMARYRREGFYAAFGREDRTGFATAALAKHPHLREAYTAGSDLAHAIKQGPAETADSIAGALTLALNAPHGAHVIAARIVRSGSRTTYTATADQWPTLAASLRGATTYTPAPGSKAPGGRITPRRRLASLGMPK